MPGDLAAAVCYRRDPPRAWACLIGPILALATCELVIKPLVGRTLGGVFSYPSGSTTGAAALAAAAVLAAPARWRVVTAVAASIYALWMALAVVALQWHLPTDAASGLAYGVGVVLVVDGSAWKVAVRLRPRFGRHRPRTVSEPSSVTERRMMATVPEGLSGSNLRSMRPSGSSGSLASITNGTGGFSGSSAWWSPRAMPVITAPVADRFIQLLNRSGSFPATDPAS